MGNLRRYYKEVVLGALILANLFVWAQVHADSSGNILSVYFLDIGQGDAIFIDSPSHGRVLIDGGPNRKVISELGKIMPFGDKRLDVVIETHPDRDHIGGLPEVFSRYDVGLFLEPGVESENSIDDELKRRVVDEGSMSLLARRGMIIDLGDGAKLEILFPNQDVSRWDTNDASIVARLVYGESELLFTGDSEMRTENILMSLDKEILNVDVLKAGHHGSRTSTSLAFAKTSSPKYTVISSGKGNTYGHPHREVLDVLSEVGSEVLNTAELGTIKVESDGKILKVR